MPGLYGFTGNANVAVANTPGLYINSGASPILTNAQQLLSLLSNDGTVVFQLDPNTGYSTVEAFANVPSSGGGFVNLVGDVTGNGAVSLPLTTTLSSTGVTPGTYGSNSNIPIITVDSKGRVTSVSVGNVANYLPGDPTIQSIQSNIVILQSEVYTNANASAFVSAYLPNYLPGYLNTYTGNISANNINATQLYTSGNATIYGNLLVYGNVTYNTAFQTTTQFTNLLANSTTPSTDSNTGAIISYGGLGVHGSINAGGNINTNVNINTQSIYSTNYYWANGLPLGSSVYSNANVAAYLAANTDPTIVGINSNVRYVNANLASFETYANTHFITVGGSYGNSNVAVYLASNTDPTIVGITSNIITLQSNAVSQQLQINSIASNFVGNLNAALPNYTGGIGTLGSFGSTNIQMGPNAIGTSGSSDPAHIGDNTVAIGFWSYDGNYVNPYFDMQNNDVSIGVDAGKLLSGGSHINIGYNAGFGTRAGSTNYPQQGQSIAIGYSAGQSSQTGGLPPAYIGTQYSIAIGSYAGQVTQGFGATAIGWNAGQQNQGFGAVAIGPNAGSLNQPSNSIIINANTVTSLNGTNAGLYINPVRNDSGNISQSLFYNTTTNEITYAPNSSASLPNYTGGIGTAAMTNIAIGEGASYANPSTNIGMIAIGIDAGYNQSNNSVAIGSFAGYTQGDSSVAIGQGAGRYGQGNDAVAIGSNAANAGQGNYAIAIGYNAGFTNSVTNSIILNASGSQVNSSNAGLYINPVRNDNSNNTQVLYYNTSTNEITYSTPTGGTYSNANVTALLSSGTIATNIVTTANVTAANVTASGTFFGNLIAANVLVANIGIQSYTTYNTVTAPGYSKGVLWYDNVQDSMAYYNSVTNNEVNIGQELQFNAYNGTGSQINQGVPVYLTGGSLGSLPNIAPAQANTISTSQIAGVANQNIPAGTKGCVVTIGLVANVAMGSFSVGDTLYLSPYSAGQIQNTQPPTGFVVKVGTVIYNNSPNGIFLVNKTVPVNNQYYGNLTLTGNLTANNVITTNQITAGNTVTTGTTTTGNLITTNGVYWSNGAPYSTGSGSTYSNANVASYLPVYSGNIQANYISATGGAISSNSTVGAISVGNLSLAESGVLASFQNSTNSYTYVAVQNTNSGAAATADYTAYNDQSSYMDMGINSSGYSGTGNFSLPGAGYIYTGNTDLSIGTYGNNNIHFINNNAATDSVTIFANGNVAGTNFLGSSRYFSGNLAGNVLYNGFNGTTGIAANIQTFNGVSINPIAANSWSVFQTAGASGTFNPNVATFTNYGGVQTVTTAGVTAAITQSNVVYATKGGTIQVLNGVAVQGQYFMANAAMNGNDRIRHFAAIGEAFLLGQTWGYNASGYPGNYQPTGSSGAQFASAQIGTIYSGYGNVGAQIGSIVQSQVAPSVAGAINVNWQTGYQLTLGYGAWATGAQGNSYIDISRAFYPTFQFSNTTPGVQNVTNLYGLHIIKNWENNGTAGRSVPNKRVIQNEDPNTDIYNAGNITVGGSIYTTVGNVFTVNPTANVVITSLPTTINSNLTIAGSNSLLKVSTYTATALNAITGSVGQVAAVSNGSGKNGGQLAYWDTTNNRWSWFDTNAAVS